MTTEQVRKLEPPQALIDGLLYRNSLTSLFGPSGIGKSFIAEDIAQHVSIGRSWQGHDVTTGTVIYVAAEGVSGIGIRTEAWETHHGVTGDVQWLPQAVNLFSDTWASALRDIAAEGLDPVLIVIDTLARSIIGADENSAKDIGIVIANLDMIRKAANSCVLVIHHSGKDRSTGARGSSALRGALDTKLEVTGSDGRLQLRTVKQKDAPEHPPIDLTLRPVPGTTSVVIDAETPGSADELPGAVFATLQALRDVDVPGGVSATTWQKAAEGISDRTFFRHRSGLLQHHLVTNVGTTKQPRYRPTDCLEDPDAP